MPTKPTTRDAIKRAIKEYGPMTVQELAVELEKRVKTVGSCISSSRAGKKKHFYVKEWRPQVGIAGLAAGVYAIGSHRDAEPFTQNRKATNARYYQNNKGLIKVRRAGRQVNHFASLISQVTK
ncbi:hypothetical protein [Burkholderia lata]|uniref:Uncharacterized protein n=1 Tax=Burkholderia lata (strain ATCC 17760 / DSM 23089 / LMG 22485 / NCIMB 9086 / R18194 / 383) TaxID=482957 RepID=A0A6P2GT48_BURL3|nr:hypothetical protein [Burkholderia lata]VWB07722.1 hypothetical protein BLA6863_00182 [Burkholderia lata]